MGYSLRAMLTADLHIHSHYSLATARSMTPAGLWTAAREKGLELIGTGDLTHPAWLDELEENLEPEGSGFFRLKSGPAREAGGDIPETCGRPVRFVLSGEVSTVYRQDGRTRKVHSLILLPGLEAARRLSDRLGKVGKVRSDGRPTLGISARELLAICLETEPEAIFIPAHIWTPWFSLLGSRSGFDSLEECFGDLSGHITALETGLSSDPPMNRRVSRLDRFHLVSNSDAHGPGKLAREATLLDIDPTYAALQRALEEGPAGGLAGTLEFFPHEGKYHLDGHRKCGVRLLPEETRKLGGRCPVCGKALTVGVLSRVEDLADRSGEPGNGNPPHHYIAPLGEVLSEVLGRGPGTQAVEKLRRELLCELGPELHILREAGPDDLARLGGERLSEAISSLREGRVRLEGGFDGQYGVIRFLE